MVRRARAAAARVALASHVVPVVVLASRVVPVVVLASRVMRMLASRVVLASRVMRMLASLVISTMISMMLASHDALQQGLQACFLAGLFAMLVGAAAVISA